LPHLLKLTLQTPVLLEMQEQWFFSAMLIKLPQIFLWLLLWLVLPRHRRDVRTSLLSQFLFHGVGKLTLTLKMMFVCDTAHVIWMALVLLVILS